MLLKDNFDRPIHPALVQTEATQGKSSGCKQSVVNNSDHRCLKLLLLLFFASLLLHYFNVSLLA